MKKDIRELEIKMKKLNFELFKKGCNMHKRISLKDYMDEIYIFL